MSTKKSYFQIKPIFNPSWLCKCYTFLSISALSIFISCNLIAQDEAKEAEEPVWAGFCISTTPQHILLRTLKVDFDKQIGKSKNWVVLSTAFTYRNDDANWDFSFNEMMTFGGGLSYRFYPFSAKEPKWFYLQPGVILNYSQVKFNYEGWGRTVFNGSDAIRFMTIEGTDHIYQYGGDFKIGAMIKASKSLFFDFYGGVSLRQAEYESPDPGRSDHGFGMFGPAYTGVIPTWGIRVGVHL